MQVCTQTNRSAQSLLAPRLALLYVPFLRLWWLLVLTTSWAAPRITESLIVRQAGCIAALNGSPCAVRPSCLIPGQFVLVEREERRVGRLRRHFHSPPPFGSPTVMHETVTVRAEDRHVPVDVSNARIAAVAIAGSFVPSTAIAGLERGS